MKTINTGVTGRKPAGETPDHRPENESAPYRLLSKRDVVLLVGMSVSGFNKLLERQRGPPITRIGNLVRFTPSDVETWLVRCRETAERAA